VLRAHLSWSEFIDLVTKHKDDAFELDAEIDLMDLCELEGCSSGSSDIAKRIAEETWKATCYRFMLVNPLSVIRHELLKYIPHSYKKVETSRTSDSIKTFTFFCAQLEGEQTKQRLTEDLQKRRARMNMDRYNCEGWLRVTMTDDDGDVAGVRISHHRSHCPYLDISIPKEVDKIIEEMKDYPAAKVH